jgi:hypothetical protein
MFNGGTRERVSRLEDGMVELRSDVSKMDGKLDKLVDALSSTDGRAAERAQSVKTEMREESERKSKERTAFAMFAFGLLSAIALIVVALTGPYIQKLETTATGQSVDMAAISAVREVLAQQGAAIGRNGDSIDLAREKNRLQDAELRDHDRDDAAIKQALADRHIMMR